MLTRPGRTDEVTEARDLGPIHLFRHTMDSLTRFRNRMPSRPIRSICPATRRVSRPAGRSLSMSTPSPTWSRIRRDSLHRHPKILQIRITLPVKQVCNHKFVSGYIFGDGHFLDFTGAWNYFSTVFLNRCFSDLSGYPHFLQGFQKDFKTFVLS